MQRGLWQSLQATTPRTRFEIPILKAGLFFSFVMVWAILDVNLDATTLDAARAAFFLAAAACRAVVVARDGWCASVKGSTWASAKLIIRPITWTHPKISAALFFPWRKYYLTNPCTYPDFSGTLKVVRASTKIPPPDFGGK